MRFGLLLFLIALPMLELALLIKLGQVIGFWPAMLIIFATAGLGLAILQYQGLTALRRGMKSFGSGEPPAAAVMDTVLLISSGILLIAPGPITDCAGILLLIPPVRAVVGAWLLKQMTGGAISGSTFGRAGQHPKGTQQPPQDAQPRTNKSATKGPVIDGEFERIDEKPIKPDRDPGPR